MVKMDGLGQNGCSIDGSNPHDLPLAIGSLLANMTCALAMFPSAQ